MNKNKKILVADDDAIVRKIVSRGLTGQPYTVVFAVNGAEALVKTREEKPDLILLDINMPEKDGRQVLLELREDAATKDIPVIMLTGFDETMDKIAGFELGANDYITKPFEVDVLLRRIRAVC